MIIIAQNEGGFENEHRQSIRGKDCQRMINFIDALVSILTLQNTLIMVNMKDESNRMLPLTAVTSAAIMLAVLALSIAALRKGVMRLKRKE